MPPPRHVPIPTVSVATAPVCAEVHAAEEPLPRRREASPTRPLTDRRHPIHPLSTAATEDGVFPQKRGSRDRAAIAVVANPYGDAMPDDMLTALAARQGNVLSRANLLACGISDHVTLARVNAGYWQRVHRGVVAMFPGELSLDQRAWAAVLYAQAQLRDGEWALIADDSAARFYGLRTKDPETIDILVPHRAKIAPTPGVRIRRTRRRYAKVGSPGWTELEETILDLVERADSAEDVIDLLIAAFRQRVSPSRLMNRADRRKRLRNRALLLECISRTPDGVESHLEFRHHRDVERDHGLPVSTRQGWQRLRGYWIRADCRYAEFGLRVELDGELAHPGRATHADVLRDNDVLLLSQEITLRFRWSHVVKDPCLVAAQTAVGLRLGGWTGSPKPCSASCGVLGHVEALEIGSAQARRRDSGM